MDARSVAFNNGVATWDEVEHASGYTVRINGEERIVETNVCEGIPEGAFVEIKANGDGTTYRSGDYCSAVSNLIGNDLADFSSEKYEALVYTTDYIGAQSVEAAYMQSFAGETNVLKVTAKAQNSEIPRTRGASFGIKLPKASADGKVKVKMYFPQTAPGFKFMRQDQTDHIQEITGAVNTWHVFEVDYGESIMQIPISIFALDESVTEFTVYFSYVRQQVDLADTLTGNYLADFSSDDYESCVTNTSVSGLGSVKNTYMESAHGETNVLKVEVENGAMMTIKLPKSMTMTSGKGTVTIRYYVESIDGLIVFAVKPTASGSDIAYLQDDGTDRWRELTVSGLEVADTIYINCYLPDGPTTIYFSAICDGTTIS